MISIGEERKRGENGKQIYEIGKRGDPKEILFIFSATKRKRRWKDLR